MLHLVGQIFVAERDEDVVGYLAQTSAGATVHLARLAVLPQFGGQGVGRRLLVAGLEFAQAAGCHQAVLNTQASNEQAQRLYRSLGFRRTGERLAVFTVELSPGPQPGERQRFGPRSMNAISPVGSGHGNSSAPAVPLNHFPHRVPRGPSQVFGEGVSIPGIDHKIAGRSRFLWSIPGMLTPSPKTWDTPDPRCSEAWSEV